MFKLAAEEERAGVCSAQRAALFNVIRQEVWSMFLVQRKLSEEVAGESLTRRLLKAMRRRGAPLRVQEKLDMLRQAAASYRKQVAMLLPEWAASRGDPEEAAAERRLGALQFQIEGSAAGRTLLGLWERSKADRLLSERAHGLSVSLDPGLRVMLRPEGFGNLQVFSEGPVGPPNRPATVNIGVLNDGSIADVYREHPVPPLFSIQPAVKVNVNVR